MVSFSSDTESPLSIRNTNPDFLGEVNLQTLEIHGKMGRRKGLKKKEEDPWLKKKKKKNQVCLEGYVEAGGEREETQEGVSRTKSLTDEDLNELKGCLDLGFGFSYEEIPELCNTLPALELCYSMSQRFQDEQQKSPEASSSSVAEPEMCSSSSGAMSSPMANWKISSPGDHPEEVKARLKFWAQAVACTVRLCS